MWLISKILWWIVAIPLSLFILMVVGTFLLRVHDAYQMWRLKRITTRLANKYPDDPNVQLLLKEVTQFIKEKNER